MSKAIAAEYQAQPWIMEPEAIKAFAERLAGLPESASIYAIQIEKKKDQLRVINGTAQIPISGYLLDKVPDWMKFWGINATGYDEIKEQLDEADSRADVKNIELIVDSPGGMVAGVMGAADSIYAARQNKNVIATVNNLAASGAYWLASQADKIRAADMNALIGSIGVYTWYADWSKYEDKLGVKVIVIRSGEHKGMGLDEITDGQISAVQEYINDTAANFVSAVARGRVMETGKIAELATGKIWIAVKARKLGLIDDVIKSKIKMNEAVTGQTAEQEEKLKGNIMDAEKQEVNSQAVENEQKLEKEKQQAVSQAQAAERARIAGLNTEFADDPAFAMKAAAEGWTVAEAKGEYCSVLRERLKESVNKPADKAEGAAALASGDTDDGAGGDFIAEAEAMAKEKGITVTAAMKRIRRARPQLHQAFLSKCETAGKLMYEQAV